MKPPHPTVLETRTTGLIWLAIVLALTGIALSAIFGWRAYRASQNAMADTAYRANLARAQSLAGNMEFLGQPLSLAEKLQRLDAAWQRCDKPFPDSFLCVIGRDGRLKHHTARPLREGTDVSENPLTPPYPGGPATVGSLARSGEDWSGRNVSFTGLEQLAAFAHSPAFGGLVAVHVPARSADAQIRAVMYPWVLGFSLAGGMVPVAILVLLLTLRAFQRKEQSTLASLFESEARFRAIFEQAAIGVARLDSVSGEILQVNQRYARHLAMTPEQFIGRAWTDLTHPEDLQADLDQMARLRVGEIREFTREKRLCRRDGTFVWVQLTVFGMLPVGETITCHIAMVEDISERKLASEELRRSQFFLRRVLDQSPAVIFAKDRDSRIHFANETMARFYGLSVEEVTGQLQLELHARHGGDPAEIEKWLADDKRVLDSRSTIEIVETGTDPEGRLLRFHTVKCPLEAELGRRLVMVVSLDITERVRAEDARSQAESIQRSIMESSTDSIILLDPDAIIRFINRTALDLTPEQVINTPIYQGDAAARGGSQRNRHKPRQNAPAHHRRGRALAAPSSPHAAHHACRPGNARSSAASHPCGRLIRSRPRRGTRQTEGRHGIRPAGRGRP
ncbi:MAG: PAS domain S-box protein [Verrucomicrobia bacterium]|nr:PAS domain S-box protein [Verrucomicrobiota bacterium]